MLLYEGFRLNQWCNRTHGWIAVMKARTSRSLILSIRTIGRSTLRINTLIQIENLT